MDTKRGLGGALVNAIQRARRQFEKAGGRNGLVLCGSVRAAAVDPFYQAALHSQFYSVQPGLGSAHADRVLLDYRGSRIQEMELSASGSGYEFDFHLFRK